MSTQRQSIHSIHNKKFWTEFFYLYESLPALWDMNNPLYKNRQVKCDAYDIMVDKLREIEPNADREDVLRKINIFRTNYRRECSRINMSLQEGRNYQSTLWYFDLLCFLRTADTRRDRKRKLLDDDGEKSIMRKRRTNNVMQKTTDQYLMPPKKEHLIEYQPNPSHDFEYDLEEEPDFDYAPDELAHVLVDGKSDCTSEIQSNALDHNNCVEEDDEEDEQSPHDYSSQQEEFQNYTLHRNNQKIKLTADNVEQLAREVINNETPLGTNEESQETEVYQENENDLIPTTNQWCIKASNAQNIASIQLQKQSGLHGTITNSDLAATTGITSKYVRDVKTMTCNTISQPCCGKPSQSSDILAKSWAVQYDELTPDQKLLARKAINDILFDGCMGRLAINSNGRVVSIDGNEYTNVKTVTVSGNVEEVESSDIYEQTTIGTSSTPSTAGVATVTVTTNVGGSHPKIHTNDEWLKL